MVKVLFVCMGNICRSPTAHGVFQKLTNDQGLSHLIEVDSAGTHAYHVGEPPDHRSQTAALARGYDLSSQRARKVKSADFEHFDYVVAMDESNFAMLEENCPVGQEHKVSLFLDFAPQLPESEVPDPYYGGAQGFKHVLDLVEAAADGLIRDIKDNHL